MPTRIVGIADKTLNIFTKYGRERNHLYRELRQSGMNYILDRKLPNNSHVILGYANKNSKYSEYSFKVNPDLSLEQKTSCKRFITNIFGDKVIEINKLWANNKGKQIKNEVRTILYRNDRVIGKTKSIMDDKTNNALNVFEGSKVSLWGMDPLKVSKLYKRLNIITPDTYEFTQYKDGSREYKKFIDGIKYYFSTK